MSKPNPKTAEPRPKTAESRPKTPKPKHLRGRALPKPRTPSTGPSGVTLGYFGKLGVWASKFWGWASRFRSSSPVFENWASRIWPESRRGCPAEGCRGQVNLPPWMVLNTPTKGRRICWALLGPGPCWGYSFVGPCWGPSNKYSDKKIMFGVSNQNA